ncbi:ABC transporter ATP-binding protein [Kocuria sp. ZOR0020]|uniref:ABC transporter ATP-binding protein n=1 Tax=Kocuria sp. ZOR0020 TaxID=1339234 RepID=UPI00068F2722|nr:ABC transporter ATP-binding protein [Kocuria sp. ZOR0020]
MSSEHATHETQEAVIRVRNVSKNFDSAEPPVTVLNNINMEIGAGEFVAVMGASGSGKSTLLYAISGMDRPTTGTVELLGKDLTELEERSMSAVRLHTVGFVFQQPYFLTHLNLRDNVMLPALKAAESKRFGRRRLPGRTKAEVQGRVQRLMDRLEIGHVAHHGVTEVSGGQLQRAAICRALASEPAVIFADEPTGALNSAMSEEVMDALAQVHATGTTVVMVTHDPACAARADRVVYLSDGEVLDSWVAPGRAASQIDRKHHLAQWLADRGF